MLALLIASRVWTEQDSACLSTPPLIAECFVSSMNERLKSEPFTADDFEVPELATAITNLCSLPENINTFMQTQVLATLTNMLHMNAKSHLQECALNALWSLTSKDTHNKVRERGNLMEQLRMLETSPTDELKQAAKRVLIKLEQLNKPVSRMSTCACTYSAIHHLHVILRYLFRLQQVRLPPT